MSDRRSPVDTRSLYDDDYVRLFVATPARRIARLVPLLNLEPDDDVADFGCGDALLLQFIHDRVRSYRGVDFSPEMVQLARQRAERGNFRNAKFEVSDIAAFCARHPESFDKAFTLDFSEHIYDDDFVRLYTAIRTSLRSRGELYLHTPNADYFLEVLKSTGVLRQQPQHVAVRNARQNRRLLLACGFREVHVAYLPHYVPLLAATHLLSLLPVVGRACQARLFMRCVK